MTKLQTSLATEETWVDGATEKLTALPTATSAFELDVSTKQKPFHNHYEYTQKVRKSHQIHHTLFLYTSFSSLSYLLRNLLFCIIIL